MNPWLTSWEKNIPYCAHHEITGRSTNWEKFVTFSWNPLASLGGSKLSGKLDAGIDRMRLLSEKIQGFAPDLAISFCSPYAARVSFGLGIKHIGFSNSPHHDAVMRLTIPLLTKLLIPSYITKKEFARYGIESKNIIKYNAMDELLILNNSKVTFELPKMKLKNSKTILFRTHESQAAYVPYHTDIKGIIDLLIKEFKNYNIIVMGRYFDEIEDLKKRYAKQDVVILDEVVDGNAIFSITDVFIAIRRNHDHRGCPADNSDHLLRGDSQHGGKIPCKKKTACTCKNPRTDCFCGIRTAILRKHPIQAKV